MSTAQIWSTESRPLSFSNIPAKPLNWLWQNYIPRGKLSLFAGDPGSGKTSLLLDLAARLSTADRLPPFPPAPPSPTTNTPSSPGIESLGPPLATLLLSPEDNASDTLRPRLESLHADMAHIHLLPAFHSLVAPVLIDGVEVQPLQHLDSIIQQIPNLALLVIDPITYYLGLTDRLAPINPAIPSPRSILHNLAGLAALHNIAIVLTTRLTKKCPTADPVSLHRALGSLAFASVARTVHLLLPNTDLTDPQHILFAPLKNNLAELPPALSFFPGSHGQIEWDPDPIFLPTLDRPLPPRAALRDESALGEAVKFLRLALADGPVKATSLQQQAEENLISLGTLRRAKEFLDCDSKRDRARDCWYWLLKGDRRRILTVMEQADNHLRILGNREPIFPEVEETEELTKKKRK